MFLTADLLLTSETSLGNAYGADCRAAATFEKEISIFVHLSLLILDLSSVLINKDLKSINHNV